MRVLVVVSYDDDMGPAHGVVALPDHCKTEEQIGAHFTKWLRQRYPSRFGNKSDEECCRAEFAWNDYEVEVVLTN